MTSPLRPAQLRSGRGACALLVLVGLALAGSLLSATDASPAPATCARPNIAGAWTSSQSNAGGIPVHYVFTQSGTAIGGTVSFAGIAGTVSGTLTGTSLTFTVAYSNGATGRYTGTVTPTSMSGSAVQLSPPPSITVTWSATGAATCPGELPPLPELAPDAAVARVQSLASTVPGREPSIIVTRDGKRYRATKNTTLGIRDVITTSPETRASLEFLIGGRVGVNTNTSIEVVAERGVADVNPGIKRIILKNGALWLKLDAADLKRPLEIQTNGGVMGIRG